MRMVVNIHIYTMMQGGDTTGGPTRPPAGHPSFVHTEQRTQSASTSNAMMKMRDGGGVQTAMPSILPPSIQHAPADQPGTDGRSPATLSRWAEATGRIMIIP